jgi:hypothetical protein
VRYQVPMATSIINARFFWDILLCSSYKSTERSAVLTGSTVALIMDEVSTSETQNFYRATRRNIRESSHVQGEIF